MKGLRVVVDPLGGLYLDERMNEWRYQRSASADLQADLIVVDIAAILFDLLQTVGAEVFATRCLRKGRSVIGESGRMAFTESAYIFLRSHKVPPSVRQDRSDPRLPESVWKDGATNLERDRNSRVNFAKHVGADFIIGFDATNYSTDEGLEARHNGVGSAGDAAERVVVEASKRSRRRALGVVPLLDEESAYSKCGIPAVILNCGSTFDPFTANNLRHPWYRNSMALGAFAGIWKQFSEAGATQAA